jgi:hypothetical protein
VYVGDDQAGIPLAEKLAAAVLRKHGGCNDQTNEAPGDPVAAAAAHVAAGHGSSFAGASDMCDVRPFSSDPTRR